MHDALKANNFHYGHCTKTIGKRGGVTTRIETWRRNGTTTIWTTKQGKFRIPIKFGLRGYSAIENYNAEDFHTAESCPLNVFTFEVLNLPPKCIRIKVKR